MPSCARDPSARRGRRWGLVTVVVLVAVSLVGLGRVASRTTGRSAQSVRLESAPSPVFTPAHPTVADAVRDFFGLRPAPVQPIAFSHRVHVANRLGCTDYCHSAAAVGPVAGLPSVRTCMICHGTIAIDRPEVQKIAAYLDRGEDIPWQRVYGYSRSAHVRFEHAPHVRAGIECRTCHGDVANQTVATRATELTMGGCVACHRSRGAPVECVTCHF